MVLKPSKLPADRVGDMTTGERYLPAGVVNLCWRKTERWRSARPDVSKVRMVSLTVLSPGTHHQPTRRPLARYGTVAKRSDYFLMMDIEAVIRRCAARLCKCRTGLCCGLSDHAQRARCAGGKASAAVATLNQLDDDPGRTLQAAGAVDASAGSEGGDRAPSVMLAVKSLGNGYYLYDRLSWRITGRWHPVQKRRC